MSFHRLTIPGYFNGLPAGYDYINNAISGVPVYADGQKGGGTNVGTYFVAFGDDATSGNTNRPAQALAQNCDHLDDLMHRDIAVPVRSSDAVGPLPSIDLVGPGIFMGNVGAVLGDLFYVTDSSDQDITVSDVLVAVTSATDLDPSAPVLVGGGFSNGNVRLVISPSVPSGQGYRLYYGQRTNWATFPADGLVQGRVRNLTPVDYNVEELFASLHGNGETWNASWDSSIWDLTAGGLNERYSRATSTGLTPPEPYWPATLGAPGAGGWIKRTGPAFTVYSAGDSVSFSDSLNALFTAKTIDTIDTQSGGVVSYAAYGTRRSSTGHSEGAYTPGGALFLGLWPHRMSLDTALYTNIPAGTACTLSNAGTPNADTRAGMVTLSAGYFRTSSYSAIAVGFDLLEASYTLGATHYLETFVIVALDPIDPTVAYVRHLNGKCPNWFTFAPTNATVSWRSASFGVGDGAGAFHCAAHGSYSDSVRFDGLFYQVPPNLSATSSYNNVPRTPPFFSARTTSAADPAMWWGGFDTTVPTSGPSALGILNGDGGLQVGGLATFNASIVSSPLTAVAPGIHATGNGAVQAGGVFVGSSDPSGGNGVQATALIGRGVSAQGGGWGYPGVYGIGGVGTGLGTGGDGVTGVGAGGNLGGAGVRGTGGIGGLGAPGVGGYFTGGGTTAIQAHSGSVYVDTDIAATADPGSNRLWATNIPKCWGVVHVAANGSDGVTIIDGFNIDSVATNSFTNGLIVRFTQKLVSGQYVVTGNFIADGDPQSGSAWCAGTDFLSDSCLIFATGCNWHSGAGTGPGTIFFTIMGRWSA